MQLAADVGHPHAAAFIHQIGKLNPSHLSSLAFWLTFLFICLNLILTNSENPAPKAAELFLDDQSQGRESKQSAPEGPLDRLFACCRMRV
jgi:hypothetical protein